MARRPKKIEEQQGDLTRTLFLSLNLILLAFFILLVALSEPNKTKEAEILKQVQKAFRTFGGAYLNLGKFLEERGVSREKNPLEATEAVEEFLGELTRFIQDNEQARELSYQITSEGLTIHLSEKFTFGPGSDRLVRGSAVLLSTLLNLIERTANPVRIEGHTDNRELVNSKFRNHFELSAARAMAVFRFFMAGKKISPERFSVVGLGSQQSLSTNLLASGRARNRRVTVTLVGRLRRLEDE